MDEIEIFYLRGCPYCENAKRAVAELLRTEPVYGALTLRWIEENEEKALADSHDYYRVPSVFCLASSVGEQEQIRLSLARCRMPRNNRRRPRRLLIR